MMRRLIFGLFLAFLLMAGQALAAGSVTVTGPVKKSSLGGRFYLVTFDWTADTDGSVPNTSTTIGVTGYVVRAITDPGAAVPTADYDITLEDKWGCDIFGGELNDRSATATQQGMPRIGNGYGKVLVHETLTFKLTNNSVNSATGKLYVFIVPLE
jgi:hypothetical protein